MKNNPPKIILYSAKMCSDCMSLKSWLEKQNIPFENRDIRENANYGDELESAVGKRAVPHFLFGNKWVQGYQKSQPFSAEFVRDLLKENQIEY